MTQSILDALVQLTVGGIVMVIGVLILVAWIKLPGGNWVRVVGGAAVTLVGALVIYGYFGGMQ